MDDVTVVVASRNRVSGLCRTLERLLSLPERPGVIVVDNASTDGTAAEVERNFPSVRALRMRANAGAAARTVGAAAAPTPYVAFSDDDSWWEPTALPRAAQLFDRHPALGLLAARTLVGPDGTLDPVSEQLARSPLPPDPRLPGPPVLGFLACSAVVRRDAFLAAGGFSPLLLIGGEEELLAYDLAAAGWGLAYVPEVVARHDPSPHRGGGLRRRLQRRNQVLVAWMRRSPQTAAKATWELATDAARDPVARGALRSALAQLPRALAQRRRLPAAVESAARAIEVTR